MRETTTIRDGLSVPRDSSDRGTNRLPSSTALEAEVLEFTLEDGTKAVAEFVGGALRWRATSPDEQTVSIQGPCNAVLTHGDVRRAKLYYLRERSGKAAKVKEKRAVRP